MGIPKRRHQGWNEIGATGYPVSPYPGNRNGTCQVQAYPRDPSGARRELGRSLWRLADLVQADERRRSFRAKAYRNAVWSLDHLSPDLQDSVETMRAVPGIGAGVVKLIEEFKTTDNIEQLDRLSRLYPKDVAKLRRLPRMTATMLKALKLDFGVEHASDLTTVIESGMAEEIRGIGPTTMERWLQTIQLTPFDKVPDYQAFVLAQRLAHHLEGHVASAVRVAGEVRRVEEWVTALDLVAAGDAVDSIAAFLKLTAVADSSVVEADSSIWLTLHAGIPARVWTTLPEGLGVSMLRATGPAAHVDRVLQGSTTGFGSEEAVYQAGGLPWIPPAARDLPLDVASAVIQTKDIKGDLHLHTEWSPDGRMTISELCERAVERGYEYLVITDHTSGLRFGGLDGPSLIRQREDIDEVRDRFPGLTVLHGAELNADREGDLDIEDEFLELLDLAVVGLHSHFDLDELEQTRRLLRAMSHPIVRVIAHPTGRRLGIRPEIALDFDAVIAGAIEHSVALESNGHRDRLDLSAPLLARAIEAGALIAANSDAHRRGEMANVANAVATLQRAGATAAPVINTLPGDQFLAWVAD